MSLFFAVCPVLYMSAAVICTRVCIRRYGIQMDDLPHGPHENMSPKFFLVACLLWPYGLTRAYRNMKKRTASQG